MHKIDARSLRQFNLFSGLTSGYHTPLPGDSQKSILPNFLHISEFTARDNKVYYLSISTFCFECSVHNRTQNCINCLLKYPLPFYWTAIRFISLITLYENSNVCTNVIADYYGICISDIVISSIIPFIKDAQNNCNIQSVSHCEPVQIIIN